MATSTGQSVSMLLLAALVLYAIATRMPALTVSSLGSAGHSGATPAPAGPAADPMALLEELAAYAPLAAPAPDLLAPSIALLGLFGSEVVEPAGATDEWCSAELADARQQAYAYDPMCEEDTLRQGNFSSLADLRRFDVFPTFTGIEHRRVTDTERQRYWRQNPHPYGNHCGKCHRDLVHTTLYRARRWWRLRGTATLPATAQRLGGRFLNLHPLHFELHNGVVAGHYLQVEPVPETHNLRTRVPYDAVDRVVFCARGEESAVALVLTAQPRGSTGPVAAATTHVLQFLLPEPGLRCFWRSLQLLVPSVALRSVVHRPGACTFDNISSSMGGDGNHSLPLAMPPDATMPYTPCHAFDFNKMAVAVQKSGNYGRVLHTFWPFKCMALRRADRCNATAQVAKRSRGVSQNISVAVALSGFLRSFGNARVKIDEHLVKPHHATLFVATWNVIGRAKKTVAISPKMIISQHVMYRTVAGMMGLLGNESTRRLEVLDYKRLAKMQATLKANGFQHPGLYYAQVRALQLVIDAKLPFDVVIRSRTDIFPAVPLRFVRMAGPDEYALDLGSQCLMDGMWWPQWAKFGEGKLLKHYADTRMKYFSWQVCDWIEIGTYRTVTATAGLYDWVQANNVFSAAQFVEHAFYVDQNITYQPLQLYLKIMRHRGHFFG
jgi:hypothetical protein